MSGRVASAASAKPRLRGLSHAAAFLVAVPLGVVLVLEAETSLGRLAAIVFAASVVDDVRRQRPLPLPELAGRAAALAAADRPRRHLRADRRHLHGFRTARAEGQLAAGRARDRLDRGAGGDRLQVRLDRRAHVDLLGDRGRARLGRRRSSLRSCWTRSGSAARCSSLAGGLLYTAGALVYAFRRPDPYPAVFGFHEVFHVLVIAAVACQYAAVAFFVLPEH